MHKRIAGSRLEVMENAGHVLFLDQPDRFNALLTDFLKSLAQPSSTPRETQGGFVTTPEGIKIHYLD